MGMQATQTQAPSAGGAAARGESPIVCHLLIRFSAPALEVPFQLDTFQVKAGLLFLLGIYLVLGQDSTPGCCLHCLGFFCHTLPCLGQVMVYVKQLPQEVRTPQLFLKT